MNGTGKTIAILALAGFMAACNKDEGDIEMLPYSDSFGKHLKTLTIYDDTGENSAELLVGADHQDILDLWQADNFRLVVSKNAASVEADVEAFLQKHAPQDQAMTPKAGTPKPNEPAAHITTRFLSKQLQPDVVAVNLATLPPYGNETTCGAGSTRRILPTPTRTGSLPASSATRDRKNTASAPWTTRRHPAANGPP